MSPPFQSIMQEIVILSAVRTPIGAFKGSLAPLSATELGQVNVFLWCNLYRIAW